MFLRAKSQGAWQSTDLASAYERLPCPGADESIAKPRLTPSARGVLTADII